MTVAHLPTALTVELAWAEYCSLVRDTEQDRSLMTNIKHCMAVARAFERWQTLFLAQDKAA